MRGTDSDDVIFGADCILRDANGFELWLGSLDDALNLEGLRTHGISAILNTALVESQQECAPFKKRALCGRQRLIARGLSIDVCDEEDSLPRDQVRTFAEFNAEWYSEVLGVDARFCGIAADDVDGYCMSEHFAEATSFLTKMQSMGRKVLLHCIMGVNRSAALAVAYLCNCGVTLDIAVTTVASRRGHILSNDSFLQQLLSHFALDQSCKSQNQQLAVHFKSMPDPSVARVRCRTAFTEGLRGLPVVRQHAMSCFAQVSN